MLNFPKRFLFLSLVLCIVVGCKKTPSPTMFPTAVELQLTDVATARKSLLAAVTVPSLNGSLETLSAIAKELSLPLEIATAKKEFFATLKLPKAVLDSIEMGKPAGAAVVTVGVNKDPAVVLAIPTKDAEAAKVMVKFAGEPVATKENAVAVKHQGNETVWLLPVGLYVLVGKSAEHLVTAGKLALEAAQRSVEEDVNIKAFPAALAAWKGTDVKTAVASYLEVVKSLATMQAGTDPKVGQSKAALTFFSSLLAPYVERAGDVDALEIALRVTLTDGVKLFGRAWPRPGTTLAKDLAVPTGFKLDPRLLLGNEPAGVSGMARTQMLEPLFASLRTAMGETSGKDKDALLAAYDTFLAAWEGSTGSIYRMSDKGVIYEGSMDVKSSADPKALLDAAQTLTQSLGKIPLMITLLGKAPTVVNKRQKDVLVSEWTFDLRKLDPELLTSMKVMLGGNKLKTAIKVLPGRLIWAMAPDAAARVENLAKENTEVPSPFGSALLKEAQGTDGLSYINFGAVIAPALKANAKAVVPQPLVDMLSNLALPMYGYFRSGPRAEIEIRLPIIAMKSMVLVGGMFATVMKDARGAGAADSQP